MSPWNLKLQLEKLAGIAGLRTQANAAGNPSRTAAVVQVFYVLDRNHLFTTCQTIEHICTFLKFQYVTQAEFFVYQP